MTDKKLHGFATWPKDKQREVARAGGRAVHASGRGHQWTSEQAKEMGRKGGRAVQAKRRAEALQPADIVEAKGS